jgi:hypothetical protein
MRVRTISHAGGKCGCVLLRRNSLSLGQMPMAPELPSLRILAPKLHFLRFSRSHLLLHMPDALPRSVRRLAGGRGCCAAYRQPRQRAQRRASADRRWRSERWRSERWRKWEAASRAGTLCSPGGEQLSARPTAANAEQRAPHLAWFESVRATRLQTTPPTSGEEE